MKADRVTLVITVEGLSVDVVPGLVTQCIKQIQEGFEHGKLVADDGDTVVWETQRDLVEF